jgi:carbon-monoxide dehydrogenase small subunit
MISDNAAGDHEVLLSLVVNGEPVRRRVQVRQHLADFLRTELQLTGTHLGCEHGVCGACTVRLDGRIVRSCLTLAVQAEGATVETIEHVAASGEIDALIAAFTARNAAQCAFCAPAMLLAAHELLATNPAPTRDEIRVFMSGNFCRCTGYHAIIDAIADVAGNRAT